jgi:hypothetical protein
MNSVETGGDERALVMMREMNGAWQDVLRAIDQLQQTTERAREYMTEITPRLESTPGGWKVLDQFLYRERLSVELGRIAEDARRGTDAPVNDTE